MKNSIEAIYIVESPFQLLSAYESQAHFSIEPNHCIWIVLNTGGINNLNQLQTVCSKLQSLPNNLNIKNINHSRWRVVSNFLKLFIYIKQLDSLKSKFLFLGDARSPYIDFASQFIKADQTYLLDDGNDSINQIKLANKNNGFIRNHRGLLGSVFKPRNARVNDANQNISFFTFYKNPFPKVISSIHYQFSTLSKRLSQKQFNKKHCTFIGNKTPEANIVSEEYYLCICKEALEYLQNNEQVEVVHYIPHREERNEKLNKIQTLGFNILRLDEPFELYILESDKLSYFFATFVSTALDTTTALLGKNISSYSFRMDSHYIAEWNRDKIDLLYKQYEMQEIKMIDLCSNP